MWVNFVFSKKVGSSFVSGDGRMMLRVLILKLIKKYNVKKKKKKRLPTNNASVCLFLYAEDLVKPNRNLGSKC